MGGIRCRNIFLIISILLSIVWTFSAFGQEKVSKPDSSVKKNILSEKVIGRTAILILKEDEKELEGRVIKLVEGGIIFDANRQSLFFDPKEKLYTFNQIKSLVDLDGHVLFGSEYYSISELLEKHNVNRNAQEIAERLGSIKYQNKFRVNVEYGISKRTAEISGSVPAELRDFADELRTGSNLSADFAYFVWGKYGIGFHYSRLASSHFQDNVTLIDPQTNQTIGPGLFEDDVKITVLGPAFFSRHAYKDGTVILITSLAIGKLDYFEEARFAGFPAKAEGSSLGVSGAIGLDFLIARDLALGINLVYVAGSISSLSINGQRPQDLQEVEDIDRLDFNIGIKLYR